MMMMRGSEGEFFWVLAVVLRRRRRRRRRFDVFDEMHVSCSLAALSFSSKPHPARRRHHSAPIQAKTTTDLFPLGFLSEPVDDEGIERLFVQRRRRSACRCRCCCGGRRAGGVLVVCRGARSDHIGGRVEGWITRERERESERRQRARDEREKKFSLSLSSSERMLL